MVKPELTCWNLAVLTVELNWDSFEKLKSRKCKDCIRWELSSPQSLDLLLKQLLLLLLPCNVVSPIKNRKKEGRVVKTANSFRFTCIFTMNQIPFFSLFIIFDGFNLYTLVKYHITRQPAFTFQKVEQKSRMRILDFFSSH